MPRDAQRRQEFLARVYKYSRSEGYKNITNESVPFHTRLKRPTTGTDRCFDYIMNPVATTAIKGTGFTHRSISPSASPRFSYPSSDFATSQEMGLRSPSARPSTAMSSFMRPSTSRSLRPATTQSVRPTTAAAGSYVSLRSMSVPPTLNQSNRQGLDSFFDNEANIVHFEERLRALATSQQLLRSSLPSIHGRPMTAVAMRPKKHPLDRASETIRRVTSPVARVPPYASPAQLGKAGVTSGTSYHHPGSESIAGPTSRKKPPIFQPTRHGLRSWTPLVEDPYQLITRSAASQASAQVPSTGLSRTGMVHEKERFVREEWLPFYSELQDALCATKTRHMLGVSLEETLPTQIEWERWASRCAELTTKWHGRPNLSAVYQLLLACSEGWVEPSQRQQHACGAHVELSHRQPSPDFICLPAES